MKTLTIKINVGALTSYEDVADLLTKYAASLYDPRKRDELPVFSDGTVEEIEGLAGGIVGSVVVE